MVAKISCYMVNLYSNTDGSFIDRVRVDADIVNAGSDAGWYLMNDYGDTLRYCTTTQQILTVVDIVEMFDIDLAVADINQIGDYTILGKLSYTVEEIER